MASGGIWILRGHAVIVARQAEYGSAARVNAPRSTHVTAATDPFATRLRSSSSVSRFPLADDPTRAPHREQR